MSVKSKIKNNKTVVISAASLILAGIASSVVSTEMIPETRTGEAPGVGVRTPNMNSEHMTVPEPYLPETQERPFSWNYNLPDEEASTVDNRSFIAADNEERLMTVREAQQTLNDVGYNIEVDGIADEDTQTALRDFQAAQGIAQTGRLDAPTVNALRDTRRFDTDRLPASLEDGKSLNSAFPEEITNPPSVKPGNKVRF